MGASDHRENGVNGHSRGHHELTAWTPGTTDRAADAEKRELAQLLGVLRRGWRAIALITVAALTVVGVITMASHMTFAVSGSIYMGDLKTNGGMLNMVASQLDLGLEKPDITTEIEILKSRKLWTQALLASGLNVNIRPDDWSSPRYLAWRLGHRDLGTLAGAWPQLRAISTHLTGENGAGESRDLDVRFKTDTEYDVIEDDKAIAHGELDKPVRAPGLILTLTAGTDRGPRSGEHYQITISSIEDVLEDLEQHTTVTAPKGDLLGSQADVVHIELKTKAPYQARMFIDELMHAYLEQSLTWKTEEAAAADQFLTKQLENVRASLDKAGRELADFKKKSSTVDLGEEAKAMIGQIGTVEQQRVAARIEVDQLEQLKTMLAKGNVPPEAYLVGEAQDTVFIAMGQALVKAQQDYKALSEQFTTDYPPLKEAQAALQSQLKAVQSYVGTRLKRAKEQLASLEDVMAKYNGDLKTLPDTELKLVTLTQEADVYSKLYEFLLERQQQAALTKASTISQNRVLDAPRFPALEESPRLRVRVPLGLVVGLLLGVGFVLVRWRLSTTYQSENDIRMDMPGLPLFAVLPSLGTNAALSAQPLTLLASDMRSPLAEAFRLLRTNLYYSGSRDRDKALVVTSSGPGDGKTVTTLCLAAILAADGKRVLVVDGDMRKPSHHILLQQPQQPGLSGILTGEVHWTEAVNTVKTPFGDIAAISTGITPPNPAELLSSPHLAPFLAEAREKYDFILLDSPPFPLVSDALVLSHAVDRVLSVIRIGVSHRRVAEEHVQRLAAATPHYGCVINDVPASGSYGYGYGYGYGSDGSSSKRKGRWKRKSATGDQPRGS
jgi:tyrosine-protein kinase Etk/Wzc